MNKIVFLVVIVAVIAQVYAVPADSAAGTSATGTTAPGAQNAAAPPAAPAQQLPNPIETFVKMVQPVVEGSQKAVNGLIDSFMRPAGAAANK